MPIDGSKVKLDQSLAFFADQAIPSDGNGWILKERHDAILQRKTLNGAFYE